MRLFSRFATKHMAKKSNVQYIALTQRYPVIFTATKEVLITPRNLIFGPKGGGVIPKTSSTLSAIEIPPFPCGFELTVNRGLVFTMSLESLLDLRRPAVHCTRRPPRRERMPCRFRPVDRNASAVLHIEKHLFARARG
jgi:hypothetical protein